MDDIICLFKGSQQVFNEFFSFLNTWHQNIEFTYENQINNTLPFLDLNITINNNKLQFAIYRKTTHTSKIIPFNSNSPFTHKFPANNSLIHRLVNIPMSSIDYQKELQIIKQITTDNGYDLKHVINKISQKKRQKNIIEHTGLALCKYNEGETYCTIPYYGHISEDISRIFKRFKLNVSYSIPYNLKYLFGKYKDTTEAIDKASIYRLNCGDKECNSIYIGMTTRSIRRRVDEHYRSIHLNQAESNSLLLDTFYIITTVSTQKWMSPCSKIMTVTLGNCLSMKI